MKGTTKDYLFYSMKDQCKNIFALHLRPYIPISQYWSAVSCIYDVLAAFKLSCKISHINDTLQEISRIYLRSYFRIYVKALFFKCTRCIYSQIELLSFDVVIRK